MRARRTWLGGHTVSGQPLLCGPLPRWFTVPTAGNSGTRAVHRRTLLPGEQRSCAPMSCGKLLKCHQPHRRNGVHRLSAWPRMCHGLDSAYSVSSGSLCRRGGQLCVQRVCRRFVPAITEWHGVHGMRGGRILPFWCFGGAAMQGRQLLKRAQPFDHRPVHSVRARALLPNRLGRAATLPS